MPIKIEINPQRSFFNKKIIVLVDEEDVQRILSLKWYQNGGAIKTTISRKEIISLARFILNYNGPLIIDHINRDIYDNRKENYRLVTIHQNTMNAKPRANGFKGVHLHKATNKYMAQIRIDGKRTYLGIYDTEIEAAKAYDMYAKIHFGKYAYLNFPSVEVKSCLP